MSGVCCVCEKHIKGSTQDKPSRVSWKERKLQANRWVSTLTSTTSLRVKLTCWSLLDLISEVLSVGICSPPWPGVWASLLKQKINHMHKSTNRRLTGQTDFQQSTTSALEYTFSSYSCLHRVEYWAVLHVYELTSQRLSRSYLGWGAETYAALLLCLELFCKSGQTAESLFNGCISQDYQTKAQSDRPAPRLCDSCVTSAGSLYADTSRLPRTASCALLSQ